MNTEALSPDDLERMRAILNAHDANNKVGIQTIDLNNPPKVQYFHQPFPKVVYHHKTGRIRKAHNEEQLKAALDAGWALKPKHDAELQESDGSQFQVDLDPEEQAELDAVQAEAKRITAEKKAADAAAKKAAAKKK